MSIPKIFYSVVNELYEVLHVLYRSPGRRVCRETALASLVLLMFSALYGGVISKIVVVLASFSILVFLARRDLRELIHIYVDLAVFVLMVTLPAVVVTYTALGDIALLSLSLASVFLSVVSVSTTAIAMIATLGVKEMVEIIQRISKTFAILFMLTLTVIPKIVLYTAMLTLARISRTIKPRRLYTLRVLTASIGDAILFSNSISYQTLLAIKSRTIAETRYRRGRPKVIDCILLLLSILVAVSVYLRWI